MFYFILLFIIALLFLENRDIFILIITFVLTMLFLLYIGVPFWALGL